MNERNWWWLSMAVSAVLLVVLVGLWKHMNEYRVESPQIVNEKAVDEYLEKRWENGPDGPISRAEPTITIKTGMFIQSLQFFNSSEVNLSGYIWQRYKDGVHDDIKPDSSEVGFILPEQVNSGSDIEPREAYRYRQGDEELIGWYFEATLRQPFEYSHYPFDHKTVWVRLWPKDFAQNIVLVPDFTAYESTGVDDIFGIEKTIVLGTWERENTYFDYMPSSYDTNFGIADYIGQDDFPELHYNFVVKRKFVNAFVAHLLPLFLVAALLFGALLTISADSDLASRHGFSTSGVIGACSALFFVVLLAHIHLREQFAGTSIVYMEYFYFLMYGLLVAASANTYLFSMRAASWLKLIHYKDNLIPKVLFWPVVLAGMIVITWCTL